MKLTQLIIFWLLLLAIIASADPIKIERDIRKIAAVEGVSPDLAVAIAKVESQLKPNKIGGLGEIGLFQLRPEFHNVTRDYKTNIRTAMRYLKQIEPVCRAKYGEAWVICYNLGPNYAKPIRFPKKFPYYIKVKREITTLAMN